MLRHFVLPNAPGGLGKLTVKCPGAGVDLLHEFLFLLFSSMEQNIDENHQGPGIIYVQMPGGLPGEWSRQKLNET